MKNFLLQQKLTAQKKFDSKKHSTEVSFFCVSSTERMSLFKKSIMYSYIRTFTHVLRAELVSVVDVH